MGIAETCFIRDIFHRYLLFLEEFLGKVYPFLRNVLIESMA